MFVKVQSWFHWYNLIQTHKVQCLLTQLLIGCRIAAEVEPNICFSCLVLISYPVLCVKAKKRLFFLFFFAEVK